MTQRFTVKQLKSLLSFTGQFHVTLVNDAGGINQNFGSAKSKTAAIDKAARILMANPAAYEPPAIIVDPDILDRAADFAHKIAPPETRNLIPLWRERAAEERRRQQRDEQLGKIQEEKRQEEQAAAAAIAEQKAIDVHAERRQIGATHPHEVTLLVQPPIARSSESGRECHSRQVRLLLTWSPENDGEPEIRIISQAQHESWLAENEQNQAHAHLSMYDESPVPATVARGMKATW